MPNGRSLRAVLLLSILLCAAALPAARAAAQASQRCFAETGLCIAGRMRTFWEQNGGLAVFGLPISEQRAEQVEGRSLQVQWFERNRLELHPENPRPYDVLLGRLGADRLAQQGRDWFQFARGAERPGCRYFAETGQSVCGDILAAWRAHGLELDGRRGTSEAESLALFGLPLSPAQAETIGGAEYTVQWFERARFELHPENAPPYNVLLGLLGHEVSAEVCGPPVPPGPGMWVSRAELARLPMAGPAWSQLKAAADGKLGKPEIADQDSNHDVRTLAVALAYARTGEPGYRAKAAGAVLAAIGTEQGDRTLALGRNLIAYIIAADLIDLKGYDPAGEQRFREWLAGVRYANLDGRTLISTHEKRPNNWGAHAGASRIAADIYLGDRDDLERAAQVLRGWLGDRAAYAAFEYDGDLSWQADPANPVGVNPAGATRDGHRIDGAIPDDMRRGGEFRWPPKRTNYPWGALEGALAQAELLARAGYDPWSWSDRALLRAAEFLYETDREVGGWWAEGDDEWMPWVINHAYGASFPQALPARPGKNLGWSDWVYGCR
ncbi:MAG: alginate lyase family protein [Kouleothrix sp.]|nr:alginate lyase family protein [Kouleothrix sp.]